jgi:hypothetical protein
MPTFTIIENNQLGRIVSKMDKNIEGVIYTATQQILDELSAGETHLEGAYPKDFYKLVEGQAVELTDLELSAPRIKPNKVSADTLVDNLAEIIAEAGLPTIATLPAQSSWTKSDAKNAIDIAAGRARFRAVSSGTQINDEYQLTSTQVKSWRNLSSPIEAVPATLQSWADAENISAELAAQSIESAAAAYEAAIINIRDIRLNGKADVTAETGDYITVALAIITTLDGL